MFRVSFGAVPTDKRQRHKEGRQARREAALAEARRQQRRRRILTIVGISAVVLVGALLISALGGDDDQADVASDTTSTTLDITKPEVTVPEGDPPAELVIEDIEEGDGEKAGVGDTIEVHYVGVSYSNGEQFDASWDGDGPASFQLTQGSLIEGWVQGIPGMRVGGRRQLVIPPELAYGETGQGDIAPGETLVFVIDLLSVQKA